jgi:hypothetical protein
LKEPRKRVQALYAQQTSERDMRRREHYRECLSTQTVLDSMRKDDLRTTGRSNIPTRNKCTGYAGYPRSDNSDQENNVTPGPSCPVKGKDNHSDSSHHGSKRSNNRSNKPLCKRHGKKEILRHELSDSGNSSPSDDDYSPSEDDTESPSIESKST